MSYTALYRKFRPDRFEDVKGQDHIVTTLRNQIKADRIGHAYLFTGTREIRSTGIFLSASFIVLIKPARPPPTTIAFGFIRFSPLNRHHRNANQDNQCQQTKCGTEEHR